MLRFAQYLMVSVFVPSPHLSSQEPHLGPQGCMNRAFAPGSVLHIHRLVNPEPWLFDCLSWSSAPNETTFDLFFFLHHLSTPRCSCPPSQSGQTDGTMVTWDLLTCGWEKTHSLYHNRANGLFPRKLWFSGVCAYVLFTLWSVCLTMKTCCADVSVFLRLLVVGAGGWLLFVRVLSHSSVSRPLCSYTCNVITLLRNR